MRRNWPCRKLGGASHPEGTACAKSLKWEELDIQEDQEEGQRGEAPAKKRERRQSQITEILAQNVGLRPCSWGDIVREFGERE